MKASPGIMLAWSAAAREARAVKQGLIHQEHLVRALCELEREVLLRGEGRGLTPGARRAVLAEFDEIKAALAPVAPQALADRIRASLPRGDAPPSSEPLSRAPSCKAAFSRAARRARRPAAVDLLAALLEDPGELLAAILRGAGIDAAAAAAPTRVIGHDEALPAEEGARDERAPGRDTARAPALERFGRDLTRLAKEGKLKPVIGRRPVLLQVLQALARASKNNVVLVGEAGVGKTAIVEALAIRAAQGKDPRVLGGKRIVELQLGALVAGSKMRGEFESRLEQILQEARGDPGLIIFIDEFHTVIGAGRAEGGADAANLLKPALARGEFRCIGATTIEEFRKHIEGDPALERRFEKVLVPEPTREETLEILRGLKPGWEAHHRVRLTEEALEAALDLSIRFDADHRLPDKAIDLLDRAAAGARVPFLSMGEGRGAAAPRADGDDARGTAREEERAAANAAPGAGDAPGAAREENAGATEVGPEAVAAAVSQKTGVPEELVRSHLGAASLGERLKALEAFLKKGIVGQDEAVERVCRRLVSAHSGLGERRGPLAVFLFLGPSGVGKTELARRLAEGITPEAGLIRLDMSEFMEQHSVAKLVGSPPGYVGYEEEGQLTGRLRSKPYAVVLLDEVEKAHPRVLDIFLQVFDEGRLTDSKGRLVDAKNAVFVMTSNLGAQAEPAKRPIGFGEKACGAAGPRGGPEEAARAFFRPELLNRIDDRIVFRSLSREGAERVLARMLAALESELRERGGAELEVAAEARERLLQEGWSAENGVRALRRAVDRLLRDPLAALASEGKLKGARLRAVADGQAVRIAQAS